MQIIECSGSPYEIGHKHGIVASAAVARSIKFYAQYFKESCNLSWEEALEATKPFEEIIREKWPDYHEEMRGLADGASKQLLEIVALNVRTEVAFGMMSDGCTSAYCQSEGGNALLGQNWDWVSTQAPNLLIATISRAGFPTIKMVTEAGLIGKIGLNSAGVGVCLNALRIKGVAPSKLPVHLALRRALESRTAHDAAVAIEAAGGLAAAGYILVGDSTNGIGIECTAETLVRQALSDMRTIVHANNLLYPAAHAHPRQDEIWVRDSAARVPRMNALLNGLLRSGATSAHEFGRLFEDEQGWPMSICRATSGESKAQSLFNIVMDLERRVAIVREGRPVEGGNRHVLQFDSEGVVNSVVDSTPLAEMARF